VNRIALGLLGLTVALTGAGVAFSAGREAAFDTVLFALLALTLAAVGTLIVSRHPEHRIGWILCGFGLWGSIVEAGQGYGYLAAEHGWPAGAAGEWLVFCSWIVDAALWTIVVLLFPAGRLPSRRWRPVVWASLAGAALALLGLGLSSDSGDQFAGGANPLAVDSPLVDLAFVVGAVVLLGAFAAAVVSLVRRLRRSRGVERQQLKWFAYAGLGLTLIFPFATAFWYSSVLVQVVTSLALNAMPIAIGIAILRYRLYDIDLVIRRTLVYAALTATLVASYLAGVLLLQLALGPLTEDNDLAIAGSTLAAAALFRPARARIQAIVDRRFFRRRYDAERTLQRFGSHLRDEVELDAVVGDLRAVVADTMQPAHVSLWLRNASGTPPA
jgi:hypothetical protein